MRYGTKSSKRPWSMTCTLRETPRCPGCSREFLGIVAEVRNGWAWCPHCVGIGLPKEPHLAFVLEHDTMRRHATTMHGIFFYQPQKLQGGFLTAIEHYEALLAADEPLLPGIAVIAAEQSQREGECDLYVQTPAGFKRMDQEHLADWRAFLKAFPPPAAAEDGPLRSDADASQCEHQSSLYDSDCDRGLSIRGELALTEAGEAQLQCHEKTIADSQLLSPLPSRKPTEQH